MRIAFDGTALQPHRTGVGYYTEHLLHHVVEEATSDDVVVVSNGQIDTARALPARVQRHEAASPLPRQIWTQVIAPRVLRELHADVAHFTNGMMPIASAAFSSILNRFSPPRAHACLSRRWPGRWGPTVSTATRRRTRRRPGWRWRRASTARR